MVALPLLVASSVDVAVAILLAFVGVVVARRHASPAARRAQRAFAVWWWGLSVTTGVTASREVAGAFGVADAAAVVAVANLLQYAYVVALCAAVWGLLYYLLYLYTGRSGFFWPLATFYGLYGLVALGLIIQMRPAGISVGKWFAGAAYASPQTGGVLLTVMVLLLLLPQLVAAAAYATLYRKVENAESKYRIALVSGALFVWLGLSLVAPFIQLGRFEAWQAGGRLVGLAAAVVILMAFRPPAWVRARWRNVR